MTSFMMYFVICYFKLEFVVFQTTRSKEIEVMYIPVLHFNVVLIKDALFFVIDAIYGFVRIIS